MVYLCLWAALKGLLIPNDKLTCLQIPDSIYLAVSFEAKVLDDANET